MIEKFSNEERKNMVLNILKDFEDGATTRQMTQNYKIKFKPLKEILNMLVDENKIREIKFGNAFYYKINEVKNDKTRT